MPNLRSKHLLLVYFAALAYVFGTSYTIFVNHDASFSSDEQSYFRMAQGDFAVSATHRYRVVVPVLAAAAAYSIGGVLQVVQPDSARGQLPLGSGFFVVNALLMAWAGLFLFLTCVLYGASPFAAFVAMTAVLTSAYAGYFTGIALTDSLYLLVFALTLYGLRSRSASALLFCIFIGPLAKESFVFLVPVIFFFGHQAIPRRYQVPLFLLSGLLTFGIRHLIDQQIGVAAEASLINAVNHFGNVGPTIRKLFSGSGLAFLWSAFGFFYLPVLAGLFGGESARATWLPRLDQAAWALVVVVVVHILLSGEIGRMAFFAAPVFAVALGLVFTWHPLFRQLLAPFTAPPEKEPL